MFDAIGEISPLALETMHSFLRLNPIIGRSEGYVLPQREHLTIRKKPSGAKRPRKVTSGKSVYRQLTSKFTKGAAEATKLITLSNRKRWK